MSTSKQVTQDNRYHFPYDYHITRQTSQSTS